MLRRLITYVLGTLRIEVSRGSYERFLNLALHLGLRLWEIERLPDRMRATLTVGDFLALRPVARQSRCRVRILRRAGLPFAAMRLRRRPLLLLGAAAALAALTWAAGHLWLVEVRITGPGYLDARAVAAVAAEAGLRRGAWRGSVDLPGVALHLRDRIDEITWAVIRVQGTRAVIEVVEKAAVTPPNAAQCVHLVARKSGVVEQVVPFQGEPLVKQGHVVLPGDLLVECALRFWAGGRPGVAPGAPLPPREDLARTLVAQASVKARLTYRQYLELPVERSVLQPTGAAERQWVLNLGARSILLRGRQSSPFARHEEQVRRYALPAWRNGASPVEVVIRDWKEVTVRREPIPEAESLARATAAMQARLAWLLGPSDRVVGPITAQVTDRTATHVGIVVTALTLEEIAAPLEGTGPIAPALPPAEGKTPQRP